MKTVFLLFVISQAYNGGVGFVYKFTNKQDCVDVVNRIIDKTTQYAFCKEIKE